jgi:hypothetical protein
MKRSILCHYCRFRRPGIPMTCDAYPDGVPRRFRFGDEKHVKPAEGDHGIQFEMADDLPEPSRAVALMLVESVGETSGEQAPGKESATAKEASSR